MKKPYSANLLNSITLILLGLWEYYSTLPGGSWTPNSPTVFLPVIFGVALFLCNAEIKKENKLISHIAVFLTLIILGGLCFRLTKEMSTSSQYRMIAMIATSAFAMITFVISFINANKNK